MEYRNSFGQRFKQYRQMKGLSQSQMGKVLSVSQEVISRWESGGAEPTLTTIRLMERALGRDVTVWLLSLDSEVEHEGVGWREELPPNLAPKEEAAMKLGIQLFRALFVENNSLQQLKKISPFRDYDIPYLYSAFKAALQAGVFRLTKVPRDTEKENTLRSRFPQLRDVFIAHIPKNNDGTLIRTEFVAFLAASEALGKLARQQIVGLGSGYTIFRFVEQSFPNIDDFKNTKWVPMVVFTPETDTNFYSANEHALRMQHRHPGSEALYLPFIHERSSTTENKLAEIAQQTCAEANSVFFSVNAPGRRSRDTTLDTLNQFRASDGTDGIGYFRKLHDEISRSGLSTELVGEVLGLLVNSHAQLVGTQEMKKKYRDLALQIDFDILRRIADTRRAFVIAARGYKAPVVLMVIKTGLVNSLVIDSEIAEYLIDCS